MTTVDDHESKGGIAVSSPDWRPERLEKLRDDFDFPVSDQLREHIKDGVTLSRTGRWWTAILFIEDPRRGQPFVALYRWQKRDGTWKRAAKFNCWNSSDAKTICSFLEKQQAWLR
jgi:hypothetical protein